MNTATRNNNMNYAIGLILYYPKEHVIKRINLMNRLGFYLYIFDNSPFNETSEAILSKSGNIQYMTAGRNIGVARSLSVICATAYAQGHNRLLFLDQDTGVSEQTLGFISEYSQTFTDDEQNKYAAIVFGEKQHNCADADASFAISSGSLFSLDILKIIGWHNDKYFVDCVDYEFCLRSIHYGYKIRIVYNTPGFDHVTEQPDREICLLGKRLLVRRYAYARIKDAIFAYMRLLWYTVLILRPVFSVSVIRSMFIYLSGQFIARLTIRREYARL